jgi:hypothetical protein
MLEFDDALVPDCEPCGEESVTNAKRPPIVMIVMANKAAAIALVAPDCLIHCFTSEVRLLLLMSRTVQSADQKTSSTLIEAGRIVVVSVEDVFPQILTLSAS